MRAGLVAVTALFAACGEGGPAHFLALPDSLSSYSTLVFGYVGGEGVRLEQAEPDRAVRFVREDAVGDRVQVLAYAEPPEVLGIERGAVETPRAPCTRRCALLEPEVWSARREAEGWSEWQRSEAAPALLERLLPSEHRGPCEACRAFEVRQISLPTPTVASFLVRDPHGGYALIGLPTGLLYRIGRDARADPVCALEPEPWRTAAWIAPDRLLLGEGAGVLRVVDPTDDCAVVSSTQSPSRQPFAHVAVHPSTGAYYLLTTHDRLERYRPGSGFEVLAQLPSTADTSLGGIVFDGEGAVFAANGSTHYAYGSGDVHTSPIEVETTLANHPPNVRGLVHHPESGRILLSIEEHGVYAFRGGRSELVRAESGESTALAPYGRGSMLARKNGIVLPLSADGSPCPAVLVGARRSPRLMVTLGARVLVGDPFTARTDEGLESLFAAMMVPADGCWLDEAH